MADMFSGIRSPTAEPAPQSTSQSAPEDDNKNNVPTTPPPTMACSRATTAPPHEARPTTEREDNIRAQSLEYKTQLEQPKPTLNTSQPPSQNENKNNLISGSATPSTTTLDPRDAAATIQALRQQLFACEQHTLYYRYEAGRHIYELEHLLRTTWDRGAHLEANVNYLTGEIHKANAYNGSLNEHVHALRKEAEIKEAQHRVALKAAGKASSLSSSSRTPSAPPPPRQPLLDTNTQLEHNRTSIRALRAEVRELKASKKQLQDRLLELGSAPAVDDRAFFQNAGVPREVLNEWSQVLLGRDREIASLWVIIEREREAR